ncbi:MAG TPA: hypothetical protein VFH61_14890 [Thermoleophilia bacterium]|nr:hypothetical protein [Thermoleophilia bacterium]
MQTILDFLDGKKTILGTVALGVLGVLLSLSYIDAELFGVLASLVAIFTGVSAVAHVTKNGPVE